VKGSEGAMVGVGVELVKGLEGVEGVRTYNHR
jgi:hypothetical protein